MAYRITHRDCGGPHSAMDIALALHPAAQGLNHGVPEVFSKKEKIVLMKKLSMLPRLIESTAT